MKDLDRNTAGCSLMRMLGYERLRQRRVRQLMEVGLKVKPKPNLAGAIKIKRMHRGCGSGLPRRMPRAAVQDFAVAAPPFGLRNGQTEETQCLVAKPH